MQRLLSVHRWAASLIACLVVSSCSPGSGQEDLRVSVSAPVIDSSVVVRTSIYRPPPADLPVVSVAGHDLEPALYLWRVDGNIVKRTPTGDSDVQRNPQVGSVASPLSFIVDADSEPTVIRLSLYGAVDSQNVPDQESGLIFDCLEAPECSTIVHSASSIEVLLNKDLPVEMAVLYLEYVTFEPADVDESVAFYSASWVAQW